MPTPAWSPTSIPPVSDVAQQQSSGTPGAISATLAGLLSGLVASGTLTVSAGAQTPMTIVTSVPTEAWYRADLGVTVTTGNVTGFADQSGNANNMIALGSGPTVTAADATISNLQTFTFSASQGLYKNPIAHSLAPPFTYYLVMKPIAWTNAAAAIGDAASGKGQIADAGGTSPNVFQYNGSYVNQTVETIGSWQVYKGKFTNSTSDSVRVGTAAEVTGANSGNASITQLALNPSGGVGSGRSFAFRQLVAFRGVPTPTEETNLIAFLSGESGSILHW